MSRVCDICGRGTVSGQSRSHSNVASKRTFKINLQTKRINGQKKRICSRCLRTSKKEIVA